jgi:hypothetical protein
VTWAELIAQATDPLHSQQVLDVALAAVAVTQSAAIDAAITAEVPTPLGLCAILDAHRVPVPADLVAQVCWRVESTLLDELDPMPQQLRLASQGGL